jgi:hypothetical protein
MTKFRYYGLYDDGRIASGMDIAAPALDSAIGSAHEPVDAHPTGTYRHLGTWPGQAKVGAPRANWRLCLAGVDLAKGSTR